MDDSEASPDRLLLRVQSGERDALGELLARHLPAVEGYVRRHAGRLLVAHESAGDLAQSICREVLERVADGRVRFQGEAQFQSWLYRAAVMKMMSRRRYWQAERRDPARVVADPDGAGEPAHPAQPSPSREALVHEDMDRLAAALAQLSDAQREVVLLHHVEGQSHAEIARQLGISESHSRVQLSRALARLSSLTGGGPDQPGPPPP